MVGKRSIKGNIILKYIKEYPDMPNNQLARIIYNENIEAWNSIDSVRSLIRTYKGQKGAKSRGEIQEKQFFTEPKFENMFNIQSEAIPIYPYELPKAYNDILLLSDIHLPYHDLEALNIALEYGKEKNVNTIILNGDIMDAYQASSFQKDPRKRDLAYEFDVLRNFFKTLRDNFPTVKIFFKQGNHDRRYEKFVRDKAPELLNIKECEFEYIAHFGKYDIQYIKDKRIIQAGKLSIMHGDEIRGAGGVNPARWLYLKGKVNAICGHFHRTSEHTEPDLVGSLKGCWSVGCLSELHPEYDPNPASNKWNHGFAHILWHDRGFEVHNKRIIKGKIV